MFLVRTTLAQSAIHGVGVFAAEPIGANQPIWRFDPAFDKIIPASSLDRLSPHARDHVIRHAEYFPELGEYHLSCDGDQYMNHSDTPNLRVTEDDLLVTLRPIIPGEELTIDYGQIGMIHHIKEDTIDEATARARRVVRGRTIAA